MLPIQSIKNILMSIFIAKSLLKQDDITEKQFVSFLNHLLQSSSREYLSYANNFDGKRK